MYRPLLARTLQRAVKTAAPLRAPATRSIASVTSVHPRCSFALHATYAFRPLGARAYSAPAGLKKDEVEGRIMDILKNFDKVQDPTKLNTNTHFANDLGLDSLDTVEVVMAIEEEFSIEIPDKEADQIHSIDKAVSYILAQPDAH